MTKIIGVCPCCGGKLDFPDLVFRPEAGMLIGQGIAIKFSKNEGRLFGKLWDSRLSGRISMRAALMDAVYWDHPDSGPEEKIIDVLISKIRRKLRDAGFDLEISNRWGEGFFLKVGDHG